MRARISLTCTMSREPQHDPGQYLQIGAMLLMATRHSRASIQCVHRASPDKDSRAEG
jgi:hypothetical protein